MKKSRGKSKKTEFDFVKWIGEQIHRYVPILGLQGREFKIEAGGEEYLMEITCSYPYLDHKMRYSKDAFEKWVKGELKGDIVLHELVHVITDPLYSKSLQRFVSRDEIENEREVLTDRITLIIRNLKQ